MTNAEVRLRVALTDEQLRAMNQKFLLTEARYEQLVAWVNKHYREQLAPDDLCDPELLKEVTTALDELQAMLS